MKESEFEKMEIVKHGYVRPVHYTGTGAHTRAAEVYTNAQRELFRFLCRIGKMEHGNDAPRGGKVGEYYKANASFTIARARAWQAKVNRRRGAAFTKICEFLGEDGLPEQSQSLFWYKRGTKPQPWTYEERPDGLRRGRIEGGWSLARKPKICLQVLHGGEWVNV